MPVVNKSRSLSHELRAGEKLTPEQVPPLIFSLIHSRRPSTHGNFGPNKFVLGPYCIKLVFIGLEKVDLE
jgi:hypothetical protein